MLKFDTFTITVSKGQFREFVALPKVFVRKVLTHEAFQPLLCGTARLAAPAGAQLIEAFSPELR